MKNLTHLVILDCEHATLLLIKKELNNLTAKEAFQLWLHHKICHPCQDFKSQNETINSFLENQNLKADVYKDRLPENVKKRITELINNHTS